jgi:hypothetical protein
MYNIRFIGRTKFENQSLRSEQQLGMLLIDLYKAWNKPEKAKEWQAKLPKTEAKTE